MAAPSDEELMVAYAEGDSSAFDTLFERFAPLLMRVMQRQLFRPSEASDLVQETFLQLHRARFDFDPERKFRPWVMTIALNLKREYFRRVGRRRELPMEPDGNQPVANGQPINGRVVAGEVRAALAQLPENEREAIVLHWFEGFSFAEIAEVVGASVSAVKVRAHRGYQRLKGILEPGL